MAEYIYPDDGNIHTRQSELARCVTPAGALAVAEEKLGIRQRRSTPAMEFGTKRHEAWEAEAAETGRTPQAFLDNLDFTRKIINTEQHYATEIFAGVIFHFTIDAIVEPFEAAANPGKQEIVDYKTATLGPTGGISVNYDRSPQLNIYALLLRPHGFRPIAGHYLIECWNRERTEIQGYRMVTKTQNLRDLAAAKAMLRKAATNMINAMAIVAKQHNI